MIMQIDIPTKDIWKPKTGELNYILYQALSISKHVYIRSTHLIVLEIHSQRIATQPIQFSLGRLSKQPINA